MFRDMVLSKRFSKDISSMLPAVEEAKDAELEEEQQESTGASIGGISSRPSSRPLHSLSRGAVSDKIVVRSAKAASRNEEELNKEEPEVQDCKKEIDKHISSVDGYNFLGSKEDWDTDLEVEEAKEQYDVTGKAKYLSACELYGLVPISYYLKHMLDSEFIMDHRGLGIQATKALAVSLMTNTSIVKLSLNDNSLDGDCASALADMLKENCYISELHLANNKLAVKGAKVLCLMLLENTTIRKLSLSGNQFNDKAAQYISDALMNNQNVQYMDLSHNMFGDGSGEILGYAISENTGLLELNLSWNHFCGKSAISIAKGLGANIFLNVLDLSFNGFSNDGAAALGEALKVNNILEELNLGDNRISIQGVVRFSLCLKENKTLRVLRMTRNPMLSEGCFAIMKAIQANSQSAMELLDFSGIFVKKDFDALYDTVKATMPNLSVIHGGNSDIFPKKSLKQDPLQNIKQYFKENNTLLAELLEMMDKDKSIPMTHEKFQQDLMSTGVTLTKDELQQIIVFLDQDKKGTIDFSVLQESLLS